MPEGGQSASGLRGLPRRVAAVLRSRDARPPAGGEDRLRRLEQRVEHLEALVEGLQDAVHGASVRHEERMAELERKTEPEAIAKALSNDARRRGL
jgi:predicted transcriptional regulator